MTDSPNLFADAKLKIERANKHIDDINTRIFALHRTDTSRVEIHPEFGTERLVHEFADATAFTDLALMVGDAIHNLNCALDYTWFQTVKQILPGLADGRTKFPVREKLEELEGWLKSPRKPPAIHDLCPELSNFLLHQIRPYSGGNHAIWPIHVLDNIDKHRLLITLLRSSHTTGVSVVDEKGKTWHVQRHFFQGNPPYVISLNVGDVGFHFKEKGTITTYIIVKEGKSAHLRIPSELGYYSDLIVKVVELFEGFVPS